MNRSLWSRALGVRIRIEAGQAHREHYKNFGLVTHDKGGKASELAEEVLEYLRKSERSQAVVAEEVGISPSQLSRILSGRRAPTERVRQRLEALLQREATLQLPLG